VRPAKDINWWYVMAAIGVVGMIASTTGEFLGWWDQGGEFGFLVSMGVTIVGFVLGANRVQVARLERSGGRVEAGLGRVEADLGRMEVNTAPLEPILRDMLTELRRR
jgi:hypothetical protein